MPVTSHMLHGGNIYQAATLAGCQAKQIIDFSSNINCVSPKVSYRYKKEDLVPYADPDFASLKSAISQTFSLDRQNIALFNGASSAIVELFRLLLPPKVYLYAPLYSEYQKAACHFAGETILINRFDALDTVPEANSTVVFVNPSTPDGTFHDLDALFDLWDKQSCTVILDESFLAFTSFMSVRNRIEHYPKLYIIQSLTKYYACAGVRIGTVFSQGKNLKKLLIPAWNLSSLDQSYLLQALLDKGHAKKSARQNRKNFATLHTMLKLSPLIKKIYPSDANFIMVQTFEKAALLAEKFLAHKILVRDCSNFDFLGEDHLRFAVNDRKDLKKLQKALDALA